ncbi:hypothetical protein CROQUDRAFT_100018 [Cronartium quercuum f. sp. fusiforme G11]|uniref:Uncharacterized protein n=1 Tax=Cronartium quercuum f. sp. fusiforme G11 TaxID=708437 RepID=A0A9P6T6F0_9BASI|nr:hypothetical protein CROQUDRAFT_100018 [Cronartium quercuum f. sp. fusiforme G11]
MRSSSAQYECTAALASEVPLSESPHSRFCHLTLYFDIRPLRFLFSRTHLPPYLDRIRKSGARRQLIRTPAIRSPATSHPSMKFFRFSGLCVLLLLCGLINRGLSRPAESILKELKNEIDTTIQSGIGAAEKIQVFEPEKDAKSFKKSSNIPNIERSEHALASEVPHTDYLDDSEPNFGKGVTFEDDGNKHDTVATDSKLGTLNYLALAKVGETEDPKGFPKIETSTTTEPSCHEMRARLVIEEYIFNKLLTKTFMEELKGKALRKNPTIGPLIDFLIVNVRLNQPNTPLEQHVLMKLYEASLLKPFKKLLALELKVKVTDLAEKLGVKEDASYHEFEMAAKTYIEENKLSLQSVDELQIIVELLRYLGVKVEKQNNDFNVQVEKTMNVIVTREKLKETLKIAFFALVIKHLKEHDSIKKIESLWGQHYPKFKDFFSVLKQKIQEEEVNIAKQIQKLTSPL